MVATDVRVTTISPGAVKTEFRRGGLCFAALLLLAVPPLVLLLLLPLLPLLLALCLPLHWNAAHRFACPLPPPQRGAVQGG